MHLFLAVLGLHCCVGFSLVAMSRGYSVIAIHRLLTAAASLVAEHRLQARWLQQPWHVGSAAMARGLSSRGSWALEHSPNSCGSQA